MEQHDQKTCPNCGGVSRFSRHAQTVKAGEIVCFCDLRRGLGDMVSAGLAAVGVTPERVSAALGVKDCGCKRRAEALNRLGRRIGIG